MRVRKSEVPLSTLNPQPSTLNPKPSTLNPQVALTSATALEPFTSAVIFAVPSPDLSIYVLVVLIIGTKSPELSINFLVLLTVTSATALEPFTSAVIFAVPSPDLSIYRPQICPFMFSWY